MTKKLRNILLVQQGIIFGLVVALGLGLYELRKQRREISVLINAVYWLQVAEERRADQEKDSAPADEQRRPDERTY